MHDDVTLATVSMRVCYDKSRNLERIIDFIEESALKQAQLVVFPETALQGYGWRIEDYYDVEQKKYFYSTSETIPGPSTKILLEYTKKHKLYVQLGIAERSGIDGVLYNSVALLGPQGIMGVFRKIHNQFEDALFNSGNSIQIWRAGFAKLGPIICYDVCFPELVRVLALRGAEIVTMSTAWPMKGKDPNGDYWGYTYDILGRAQAMMNHLWMIQSNQVGIPEGAPGGQAKSDYYGHSRIISPRGEVVAEIGHEEGLVTAKANIQESILKSKTEDFFGNNLLKDRRPQLYGDIADLEIYEKNNWEGVLPSTDLMTASEIED